MSFLVVGCRAQHSSYGDALSVSSLLSLPPRYSGSETKTHPDDIAQTSCLTHYQVPTFIGQHGQHYHLVLGQRTKNSGNKNRGTHTNKNKREAFEMKNQLLWKCLILPSNSHTLGKRRCEAASMLTEPGHLVAPSQIPYPEIMGCLFPECGSVSPSPVNSLMPRYSLLSWPQCRPFFSCHARAFFLKEAMYSILLNFHPLGSVCKKDFAVGEVCPRGQCVFVCVP